MGINMKEVDTMKKYAEPRVDVFSFEIKDETNLNESRGDGLIINGIFDNAGEEEINSSDYNNNGF